MSEQTYYRWRNQFGGLKADDVKRLKELEKENSILKGLLADAELEKAALKKIAFGKLLSPARRRAAVHHLIDVMGMSERFACRGRRAAPGNTGQHNATGQPRPPRTIRTRPCGPGSVTTPKPTLGGATAAPSTTPAVTAGS